LEYPVLRFAAMLRIEHRRRLATTITSLPRRKLMLGIRRRKLP